MLYWIPSLSPQLAAPYPLEYPHRAHTACGKRDDGRLTGCTTRQDMLRAEEACKHRAQVSASGAHNIGHMRCVSRNATYGSPLTRPPCALDQTLCVDRAWGARRVIGLSSTRGSVPLSSLLREVKFFLTHALPGCLKKGWPVISSNACIL